VTSPAEGQHGDRHAAERAFTEIFDTHRPAVYGYLLGRVGEPDAARDLLQETFLRVWRRLDEVRVLAPDSRRAWIFTVARNLTTDAYRAQATREATGLALRRVAQPTVQEGDQPEARVETAELVTEVAAAVRNLPDDLRVILAMHAVGEQTSVQIGEALDLPAGTVRYKLSLARRALARELGLTTPSLEEARR
jgi:RNA polymerase sigma-70 factor (ECF subfamily)